MEEGKIVINEQPEITELDDAKFMVTKNGDGFQVDYNSIINGIYDSGFIKSSHDTIEGFNFIALDSGFNISSQTSGNQITSFTVLPNSVHISSENLLYNGRNILVDGDNPLSKDAIIFRPGAGSPFVIFTSGLNISFQRDEILFDTDKDITFLGENFTFNGKRIALTSDIPEAINGESAYNIAVRNGFEGTEQEWLESLKDNVPQSSVFKGDLSEIGFNGKFTFGNIIVQIYRQTDTEIRVLFTSTVDEGVNILLQRMDFGDYGFNGAKARRLTISRTGTEVDPVRTKADRVSALVIQENAGYRIDAVAVEDFSDVEVFVSPYNIGVLEAAGNMTPEEIEEVFAGVERGFSIGYRRKIGELL